MTDPTHALVRTMRDLIVSKGADFTVVLIDADAELAAFCAKESIRCLYFSDIQEPYRFPLYGRHWNAEGHRLVSERLEKIYE